MYRAKINIGMFFWLFGLQKDTQTYPSVCFQCSIANWLSNKFQAKEAQQKVKSWTEKLLKGLSNIVQDVRAYLTNLTWR